MGLPPFFEQFYRRCENPAVRYLALLRLALPSILLQSGAPLAITVQTALLGHKSAELVAAWAVVATATNAATVVFNFLVVGVTAKVSKVVGARSWKQVGSRIRLALGCAVAFGMIAAVLLWALKGSIFLLLQTTPQALKPAEEYFTLRVLGVLPQLLAMCTSGILQGYKRVNLVASLQIVRLSLDVFLSYLSLFVFDFGIRGVGIGNLLASSSSALAAFICILALPPVAGRGLIHIFPKFQNLTSRYCPKLGFLKPLSYGFEPLLGKAVSEQQVTGMKDYTMGVDDISHTPGTVQDPAGDYVQLDEGERKEERTGSMLAATLENTPGVTKIPNGWSESRGEIEDGDSEGPQESFWKFLWDGLSTMLRSALVQASFFLVLASVTALGVHAVAAHQVVMQLWMVTVYFADGFATAGTIVGSELAGQIDRAETDEEREAPLAALRIMTFRLLLMGTLIGITIGGMYWAFEENIMDLFTDDPTTKDELKRMWLFLMLIQPLNAIVFVYDGLIYAAQAFSYMAFCLSIGFVLLFLPTIGAAYFYFRTLLSAWAAKAVLNFVRLIVASYKIHFHFLSPRPVKRLPLLSDLLSSKEPMELIVRKVGEGVDSRDFILNDWHQVSIGNQESWSQSLGENDESWKNYHNVPDKFAAV